MNVCWDPEGPDGGHRRAAVAYLTRDSHHVDEQVRAQLDEIDRIIAEATGGDNRNTGR